MSRAYLARTCRNCHVVTVQDLVLHSPSSRTSIHTYKGRIRLGLAPEICGDSMQRFPAVTIGCLASESENRVADQFLHDNCCGLGTWPEDVNSDGGRNEPMQSTIAVYQSETCSTARKICPSEGEDESSHPLDGKQIWHRLASIQTLHPKWYDIMWIRYSAASVSAGGFSLRPNPRYSQWLDNTSSVCVSHLRSCRIFKAALHRRY